MMKITIADAIAAPPDTTLWANALLYLDLPLGGEIPTRIIRSWFERAWQSIAREFQEALALRPLPGYDLLEITEAGAIQQSRLPAGDRWVTIALFGGEWRDHEVVFSRTMTDENWAEFLTAVSDHDDGSQLVAEYLLPRDPACPEVEVGPGGQPEFAAKVHMSDTLYPMVYGNVDEDGRCDTTTVFLRVSAHPRFLFGTPERQQALCEFLRAVAHEANPAYGEINIGPTPTSLTVFSKALKEADFESSLAFDRAGSRQVLRGYSWVTVMPQELGDSLGGLAGLEQTQAFHEVVPLRNGGYWLKATERFSDYDDTAIRRVFEAVRPVLPAGRPSLLTRWADSHTREPNPDVPNLLVLDDARA
ncbi:hypothetical protein F4553_001985 [Allocatelliglobosispora scoriae]|uniref:DUF3396 domain-containing protein n=1 Tax=Allocatelliglobosispora scoriae TaxID=643052 RepID=A0A841BMV4_9ACTN|nr:hypothetical protein [Allocatelliglobosispora scoriae]MBB5868606.1 hypothetical protein [Allocatelliglobosispora scoriae]